MASEVAEFPPVGAAGAAARRSALGAATSPLRILHLVEAFGGGVFEVLRQLASDSAARGHRVGVAYGVRLETPEDIDSRLHDGVELIPTPWQRRSLTANLKARSELRRLVVRWKPDIVHLHSAFAGVVGAQLVPRGVPTIYTPHAYSFEMCSHSALRRSVFRSLEGYVSRHVDMVAAVSLDEARLARTALRAPRVTVIENGIPELDDGVVIRERRRTPPLIVGMGRITPQRQPEACARILGAVRSISDVRWIGGGAPGSNGARALVDADVPITGWTDRAPALDQLREADIYLHWTAWDGHPLSILEAIARDVIVIAHDIPAMRDILDLRQLCRNEAQAVDLIHRVLSNRAVREELLSLQRRKAPRYQASRMLAEWDALYGKLATQVADHDREPWVLKPAQVH